MITAVANRTRHGSIPLPWRPLPLAAIAIAVYLAFGPAPEAWVYDRAAIAQGEWWRLLTGHWVHSDGRHALWTSPLWCSSARCSSRDYAGGCR